MDAFASRARSQAFERLRELIALGRRYDLFARQNPSQAAALLAELNAPGLQESAWNLQWVPEMLRAKIARVSSVIVLDLCGMPGDPKHDPTLMDIAMPMAIAAACVVAHAYGVVPVIPARPLQGRLDLTASLIHRFTVEPPEEEEISARVHSGEPATLKSPIIECLPSRIRARLIGLAHTTAGLNSSVRLAIVTVIFVIGAIAAETFEPLNF